MLTLIYIFCFFQFTLTDQIKALNTQMEDAFNQGDLEAVANFYTDSAAIMSMSEHVVQGREDINDYWLLIGDPVKWKLEVIAVSTVQEDLYRTPYYQSLNNKPPDWRDKGFDFSEEENLVYQLGHSTLKTRFEGKVQTSEVDFILVWNSTADGFKIVIDSYAWQ